MIKPPTPVDELLRLETLRNLKILDTNPEERFDRVTRLAKRIFGTPIALVSLVDNNRQWFKSVQGLDVTETPRDVSFCGHAILDDEVLIINDTKDDERFVDNPLVTSDPHIRFYAGCPLSAPDGSKVGTLCVIDREPREIAPEDIDLLKELGQLVEEELAVASMLHSDPATGISNKAGFCQVAEHLLAMCVRTKSPATMMLAELKNQPLIDGFMGHDESDRAAIETAQLLMASFRDSDIVARIGPGTFAVLLAGSELDGIVRARKRLTSALEERNERKNPDPDSDPAYDLDVETYAIAYDSDQHANAESFLQHAIEDMAEWLGAESANDSLDPSEAKSA